MYQFIYHIIFILINPQYFSNIEQKNLLKTEFNKSFIAKDYNKARLAFEKIEDLTLLIEPELRLDAAHVYFHLGDTMKARINYTFSETNPDKIQNAVALNQLGNLSLLKKDSASALKYFKRAIESNENLNEARYNYEIIKTLYKPQSSPPPPKQQNEDQNQIEASEEKVDELDTYKSKNISKERALQLLEDLKTSEKKILLNKKGKSNGNEKDW